MTDSPDRHLVWKVAGIGVAMFAFGFALVPLYDVLCAVTGFGGKTAASAAVVVEAPDPSRTVRVEFLSSVARGTPFTLEPEVSHLEVHPASCTKRTFGPAT
jgi:cytochrome c oxidase assembly protein subunit 11